MATGEAWTLAEVQATVGDYMKMLQMEHTGQNYNKAAHNRALLRQLDGRTKGSIELKHQNISAVLQELQRPWIGGYKPRGNYQQLLAETVVSWLKENPDFERMEQSATDAMAVVPDHFDFKDFLDVQPPILTRYPQKTQTGESLILKDWAVAYKRDYLAREARNASLGRAGEELAFRYEQERLSRLGHDRLAGKVEHVANTKGDGLGFDILSFEPDGRERFIEVKTTAFAKETPFFASSNEVAFAHSRSEAYHLYRLFEFKRAPRCFILSGDIRNHCALDPVSFRCSFRAG